jgi:hypothetical protein
MVQLNELIGGEKGEGQQMAVWEKIFDELSGLMAEADEIELDNDIVKRGREIVTFVKGKKYAPPHSTDTQHTTHTRHTQHGHTRWSCGWLTVCVFVFAGSA